MPSPLARGSLRFPRRGKPTDTGRLALGIERAALRPKDPAEVDEIHALCDALTVRCTATAPVALYGQ
jgi:hypothetical protein